MSQYDGAVVDRPAWEDLAGAGPALAPLTGRASAELVVVGLGTSGLAAATHAAARGVDVLGLDAVGIAAGAAGRNGGFLLAGLADFHHVAVARLGRAEAAGRYRATLAELDALAAAMPDVVRRTGSLRIAADDAERADIAAQLDALRADGLPVERYDGPEGDGLLFPADAAVNPVVRCHRLALAALAAGARLHAPAAVTALEPVGSGGGGVQVSVAGAGPVTAGRVLVAVDGGLERLLPELAGTVRTARLQMLATAPERAVALPRPVYRRWGYDYLQQLPSGEVLIGGCRDHDDGGWDAPAEVTAPVQTCLEALAAAHGVTAPVTHRWAAHAAFAVDREPIHREVRPGVVAVGAYSGQGNLLGPMLARAAVDAGLG